MTGESFSYDSDARFPSGPFFTDTEREAHDLVREVGITNAMEAEIARRRADDKRQFEVWMENGESVPIRGWARYVTDPNLRDKSGEQHRERKSFTSSDSLDDRGGWTPPDWYVVLGVIEDAWDGTKAIVRPSIDPHGLEYEILIRRVEFVTDEDIRKHWTVG